MELTIITNDDSENVYICFRNFLKYKINKTINFENGMYIDLCTDVFSLDVSYLIGINIPKKCLPTFYNIYKQYDLANIIIKIDDTLKNLTEYNNTFNDDIHKCEQILIYKNIYNQISYIVLSKDYYN